MTTKKQTQTSTGTRKSAPEQDAARAPFNFSTKTVDPDIETIPMFYIDDIAYTVPANPRPTIGLRYLRDLRQVGQEVAVANLFEAMLGQEGYDALLGVDNLSTEELELLTAQVIRITFGADPGEAKN